MIHAIFVRDNTQLHMNKTTKINMLQIIITIPLAFMLKFMIELL